jgi:O-antigen/teichoic acid export membrane protein
MSANTEASPAPPAAAPPVGQLGRRALSLGAANAFDYAIQFLLPVVLVRCLDATDFAQYRLLWLVVGTAMAVVTLAVPGSLYYYLPRSDDSAKRLYINQTLLFLAAAGAIAAWAVSAWNPWLPETLRELTQSDLIVPAFVFLWITAWLLDLLPTVEERVGWQARAIVSLALVRAISLSLVAILTRELAPVLITLLAFVGFKLILLAYYVATYHGWRWPIVRRVTVGDQWKMAAPFWAGSALYGLRSQADQWLAAALFPLAMFASFSIAGVLAPLVNLCRQSVNHVFLPSMSRLEAEGSVTRMLELNSRANVMVGGLILPLLAFAFVFAEEIVTLVYTDTYVDAAPVMRVYIVGLVALVVELATVSLVLRQGALMMWVNLGTLVLALAFGWLGAHHYGLPGAAAGTVIAIYVDRAVTLWRIARHAGVPLGSMQDWRTLGVLLLLSMLAAAATWGIVSHYFAASGPLVRVAAGSILLAGIYGALRLSLGMDRDLVRFVRGLRHSS